jgi:hypothetical protein
MIAASGKEKDLKASSVGDFETAAIASTTDRSKSEARSELGFCGADDQDLS